MTSEDKMIDTSLSNSLADLAARIRSEHEAVSSALKDSVRHAIAAGELLIEAKAQLKHGQWLSWLAKHCVISERTAQLYVKLAKNRATIEKQMKSAIGVADLTLNEAAALCVLAGRLERLMQFAKRSKSCSGQELVDLCVEEGFGVIVDHGYDPFFHCDDTGQHDWRAFMLFLVREFGWSLTRQAAPHVEHLLQKQFKDPAEWLGEEGRKFRSGWGHEPSKKFQTDWKAFLLTQANRTTDELESELNDIAKAEGPSW